MIDQMSKMIIESFIDLYEKIDIIKDFFYLTNVHNTGAAFSILEGKMLFFYIITIIAIGYIIYSFRTMNKEDLWSRIGLILLLGGTIGNFIDRLAFQYVRDFIGFTFFGYDFAVFNIADSCLCIGVGLLIISTFLEEKGGVKHGRK